MCRTGCNHVRFDHAKRLFIVRPWWCRPRPRAIYGHRRHEKGPMHAPAPIQLITPNLGQIGEHIDVFVVDFVKDDLGAFANFQPVHDTVTETDINKRPAIQLDIRQCKRPGF